MVRCPGYLAGRPKPDGDAYIERFFRTLKEEEAWLHDYASFTEASRRSPASSPTTTPSARTRRWPRSPREFRAEQARTLLTKAA